MKYGSSFHAVLGTGLLLVVFMTPVFGESTPPDPNRYLDAVREFADNVLQYGRDTYGPKHTPLFVDGLNVNTHEPVKWGHNGEVWVLSNLASQQNLFRVLVALTTIAGDPRYKQAATNAIEYAFENLRSPNGLLHWGGHVAYDALADEKCMEANVHELEHHYPYYELMWQVDPVATRQAIEAFWSAHILDWSNLEMNRHGPMGSKPLANLWRQEYKGGPVFFAGRGVPFLVAGSDLSYAGAMLFRLSGSTEPLIWSKRLAHRYIETRSPKIGISATLYHKGRSIQEVPLKVQLSDDFKEHLLEDGMEFPSYGGWVDVAPWICHLLLGEMLDANGNEFTQWAKEELTAWGKIAYRKKDNSWIPMLIDGTNLEGYVCKRDGPLGPKGTQVVAHQAGPSQFWAYAVAYRITGDGFMWQMARNIAQGSNFGDIGETPSSEPRIEMDIARAAPTVLLGFLELFKKTEKKAYLKMAEKIGNNILSECFNKGFFTYSNKHLYAKFDFVAPLALLHLDTSLQAREWNIPKVWPVNSYFHCPYDGFGRTYDNLVIYSRTEENHLDFELFEAVHSGDTKKFAGLISNGADINATKGSFWSDTLLHSAVRAGRKNIIELLIQKGADVNKTNKDGETPLYYAALSGHKDIAELLIEKGAEMSAIHLAAYMGDIAKVKAFVREGIDINALDKRNMAALHFAARGDQTDTAELLIAQGAEVDIGSRTPLCVAVEANNIDVAEILIAQGANVNANPEWTPLQEAAYHSKEMVELLLTKGADINAGKWTALHSALDAERFDILELLLAKGADVNIRDDEGRTPLHIAAWYAASNNPKVVELLLSKGADVTAKDNDSKTALSWAVEKGHTEIVELLKKHMLLHDVMVTNATVPSACVQGDTLPVTISVANKGDQTETFRVVLFDIVSGEEIADREMTLEPQKYRSANAADLILSPTSSGKGNFGWGFNVHGDVNRDGYGDLLVGAGWWNEAKGRAYFYFGGVDMDGIPDLIFEGEAAGDFLGDGGAALGDVNGDGYDDVIIGARGYHNNDGRLYIFFGGIDVDKEADVLLEGEPGKAGYFSCNCLSVGDVDKDGYVDVLVGACFYDKKRGKVYLYYGGDPMDSLADVVFEGEHADDFFGRNATIGQDIDGDGYRDILIGARQAPEGTRNGRAYLFYGGDRNQMDAVCDMTFTPPTSGQRSFGSSLDIYDIDSDGHGDVVIGARSSQGAVFVYWGDERDKMDAIADVVILGEDGARSCLGGDKLFCADFNRDGYGDIAVGAYNWLKRSRTGRTYVYYGGTKTSINTQPDVIFTGETGGSWFGHDIGGGDFNNDGYTDLVAGAWGYNNEEGRAYVFYAPLENKTDITFNWDTTAATPGKHTLRATIAPIEGEEDTADNAMTVEVKVKTPSR